MLVLGFPDGQRIKNLPAMQETQETQVRSLGQGDLLGEEMATHSSILACKNPIDRGVWQATVRVGMAHRSIMWGSSSLYLVLTEPLLPSRDKALTAVRETHIQAQRK